MDDSERNEEEEEDIELEEVESFSEWVAEKLNDIFISNLPLESIKVCVVLLSLSLLFRIYLKYTCMRLEDLQRYQLLFSCCILCIQVECLIFLLI